MKKCAGLFFASTLLSSFCELQISLKIRNYLLWLTHGQSITQSTQEGAFDKKDKKCVLSLSTLKALWLLQIFFKSYESRWKVIQSTVGQGLSAKLSSLCLLQTNSLFLWLYVCMYVCISDISDDVLRFVSWKRSVVVDVTYNKTLLLYSEGEGRI